MKIKLFGLFISIIIIQSCAVDPPRMSLDMKVSLEKQFRIYCNKQNMIKKFDTNPTFINLDKESKNDTFYFDITLEDRFVTFGYKTFISQENKDTMKIAIDSLVKCSIKGKFLKGIEPKDIDYCKTINNEELIRIFDKAVINRLTNSDFKDKNRTIINFMY